MSRKEEKKIEEGNQKTGVGGIVYFSIARDQNRNNVKQFVFW